MDQDGNDVVEVSHRLDLVRCLVAATVVGWAAIVAGTTAPVSRGGWLVVPVAGAAGSLGGVLAGVPGAGFGALIGVLVLPVLVMVAAWTVETVSFARADRVWWFRSTGVIAVARTLRTGSGWRVESVAAVPRGRGAGRTVMAAIVDAADTAGVRLELTASSARVTRWYEGLGFEVVAGRRLRRPPVAR